jgi:hypothetical protein
MRPHAASADRQRISSMDLNQLLYQHQRALIARVDHHVPHGSRFDLVGYYERRIARLRRQMGVVQYPA